LLVSISVCGIEYVSEGFAYVIIGHGEIQKNLPRVEVFVKYAEAGCFFIFVFASKDEEVVGLVQHSFDLSECHALINFL